MTTGRAKKAVAAFMVLSLGVLVVLALLAFSPSDDTHEDTASPQGPVLFYGVTCPHCKIVEEWLDVNDPENDLGIIRKEVYEDRVNAEELMRQAAACGLPTNEVGVPFLAIADECVVGDQPIIEVLSEEI